MKPIGKCTWRFAVLVAVAALVMFAPHGVRTAFADGAGQPADGSCSTGVKADVGGAVTGNITTSSLTGLNVTATAGTGFVISGVCIKDGAGAFSEPQAGDPLGSPQSLQHSILFTSTTTITVGNDLEPSDNPNLPGCYTINGIGTATVSVITVPPQGGAPNCKNISHIDYALMTVVLPDEPKSKVETKIHNSNNHTEVTTVTMGATIHDKALVTGSGVTGNPNPTGTVDFTLFPSKDCSGVPKAMYQSVPLSAGNPASAESLDTPINNTGYLVVAADIATGLSFNATYSGDSTYPAKTSDCEPLDVKSSITGFSYNVVSGFDAPNNTGTYDCILEQKVLGVCPTGTSEATVTVGSTNTYQVNVTVSNFTGVNIQEKVQGGLAAMATYTPTVNTTFEVGPVGAQCGQAIINLSQSRTNVKGGGTSQQGNVVIWNLAGTPVPSDTGFTMANNEVCTLGVPNQVTVTKQFTSCGEQPITSSWSELQTLLDGPNAGFSEKSPYTGRLSVNVVGCTP